MQICCGIVEFVDSDGLLWEVGVHPASPGVVLVQSVQVVDSQQDTQAVDEYPDDIENIVSVGTLAMSD